jgi:XTP/dITP diphosphohydrolase/tetrapyrrole methylase family protein/MazG family protein/ATP diphosphatase
VEEAYELADAAHRGDDAKLVDELGDVLFQVYFLALLLEEREAGSLESVTEGLIAKLIRRHPHVFAEAKAATAAEVVKTWGAVKRDQERGGDIFGELPEVLPSTLYAKKVLKRAQAADAPAPEVDGPGGALLEAVRVALEAGADPELELRRAADRYREQVERGDT